jgi:hypothetical protein
MLQHTARRHSTAKRVVCCGHCRFPIEETDFIVPFEDATVIHVRCWRVDATATLSGSSALVRQSRKMIEESRRIVDTHRKSGARVRCT